MTMRVVVLTKRQYTNKDVIDDRYGRLWEIPMALAREGHDVTCVCLSYQSSSETAEIVTDGRGNSVRNTRSRLVFPGIPTAASV